MTYKTQPKTEYKPNADNIKHIVENLYHAISGNKPDEKMKERLYAGVDGMIKLYEENPNAFYALAAVALSEGADGRINSNYGSLIVKYLAQSMIEESGYAPRKNNESIESKLGGE